MKRFTSKPQKVGEYGEEICISYLKSKGFIVIERNFTIREGEVDIIASKGKKIHFIEVKSISCKNTNKETIKNTYNPAENMTRDKIQKCMKTIREYKKRNSVSCETELDLYIVYIDNRNIKHKIEIINNIF